MAFMWLATPRQVPRRAPKFDRQRFAAGSRVHNYPLGCWAMPWSIDAIHLHRDQLAVRHIYVASVLAIALE
jgi:hypothetical protein